MTKKPKVPKKKTKSFNGCWSCRERGRKCDEQKPACNNCIKNSIVCKGYDIRLSWDVKKADNLRRLKVYHHLDTPVFYTPDLDLTMLDIDNLVENCRYRHVIRIPFTVFEANDWPNLWNHQILPNFHLPWLIPLIINRLNDPNVVNSVYSSYLMVNDEFQRAHRLIRGIWSDFDLHHRNYTKEEAINWILSALNILFTFNLSGQDINFTDCINRISKLIRSLPQDSEILPQFKTLIAFLNSLKFDIPTEPFGQNYLFEELGIPPKLLNNWYQILTISSNKNLSFFKLENELWFNKRNLLFDASHPNYHKSYIWYIAMYIYFIKKFYHQHHGTVSVKYLVNEVIPHLKELNYRDLMGIKWCLFVISHESTNQECNTIISEHLSTLKIESKGEDWIEYLQKSTEWML